MGATSLCSPTSSPALPYTRRAWGASPTCFAWSLRRSRRAPRRAVSAPASRCASATACGRWSAQRRARGRARRPQRQLDGLLRRPPPRQPTRLFRRHCPTMTPPHPCLHRPRRRWRRRRWHHRPGPGTRGGGRPPPPAAVAAPPAGRPPTPPRRWVSLLGRRQRQRQLQRPRQRRRRRGNGVAAPPPGGRPTWSGSCWPAACGGRHSWRCAPTLTAAPTGGGGHRT